MVTTCILVDENLWFSARKGVRLNSRNKSKKTVFTRATAHRPCLAHLLIPAIALYHFHVLPLGLPYCTLFLQ